MPSTFATVRNVVTGAGAIAELGRIVSGLGARSMLVSGDGSLERAGTLERARESLRAASVEFDEHPGVLPEPQLAAVELLRGRLHEGFDVVVSVGGGSVIDVAKAAAGLVNESAPAREYHSGLAITKAAIPHVAVPTTAGTGTEVTPNAVLTDPESPQGSRGPRKASIRGDGLLPAAAIIDPELLLTLPPRLTAETGMDALTQAIESYVSVNATPLTEAMSLHAVSLLARGLVRAFEDGSDLDARSDCAYGSLLAGVALANARLGIVHGIAHPLGARYHLPHGLVCAVLLAPSIRLNEPAAPDKYAEVARRLAASEDATPSAAALVEAMLERLGLPEKLPSALAEEDFADLVAAAMPSGSLKANPLKAGPAHVERLLREVAPDGAAR